MRDYYVYIMASKRNGTLYVGVTSNLERRVYEHKEGMVDGFSNKYGVDKLVHYERFGRVEDAIAREKCIKRWKRVWKLRLIEEANPEWNDLGADICD